VVVVVVVVVGTGIVFAELWGFTELVRWLPRELLERERALEEREWALDELEEERDLCEEEVWDCAGFDAEDTGSGEELDKLLLRVVVVVVVAGPAVVVEGNDD